MGWRCEFQLQGAAAPNATLAKLPLNGGQRPVPYVIAGSLFECQYRLSYGDGGPANIGVPPMASNPPEERLLGVRSHRPAPTNAADADVKVDPIRVVEHSMLWQTTGKGDRDFGIHLFERRKNNGGNDGGPESGPGSYGPIAFKTISPLAPLSYQGQLISIDWLVRVRVFLQSGRQLRFEQPFDLVLAAAAQARGSLG